MTTARTITRDLGGRWHGSYGTARCPAHDDRNASLSVRDGNTGPLLKCHAGCESRDVFRALRDRGVVEAKPESCNRLQKRRPSRPPAQPSQPEQPNPNRERAVELWRNATAISGTPAEAYLLARGLDPARLDCDPPGWPETLAYHPNADGRGNAALVVAVNAGATGLVTAVQRVFVHADGTPARDDDGSKRKMALGPLRANAARLSCWPDPDGVWGLAEGVETALAARQITGRPTWAAISANNMPNVKPPRWARHALVFADHDASGTGMMEASKALHALRAMPQIESVRVLATEVLGTDAADLLGEAVYA